MIPIVKDVDLHELTDEGTLRLLASDLVENGTTTPGAVMAEIVQQHGGLPGKYDDDPDAASEVIDEVVEAYDE